MAIELTPKQETFEGPSHELYVKTHKLLNRIDGLTLIEAYGVLAYIQHQLMHEAMDLAEETDEA